jgi:hypothetical protein
MSTFASATQWVQIKDAPHAFIVAPEVQNEATFEHCRNENRGNVGA